MKEIFLKSIFAKALVWGIVLFFISIAGCFVADLNRCGGISGCEFLMLSAIKEDLPIFGLISFLGGIIVAYILKNNSDTNDGFV